MPRCLSTIVDSAVRQDCCYQHTTKHNFKQFKLNKMKNIIVIHEKDKSDNDKTIIGVASNRIKALEMMEEYYGKGQHVMTDFKDIREDNIDFTCKIEVEGVWGGFYEIWGEDFCIDSI